MTGQARKAHYLTPFTPHVQHQKEDRRALQDDQAVVIIGHVAAQSKHVQVVRWDGTTG